MKVFAVTDRKNHRKAQRRKAMTLLETQNGVPPECHHRSNCWVSLLGDKFEPSLYKPQIPRRCGSSGTDRNDKDKQQVVSLVTHSKVETSDISSSNTYSNCAYLHTSWRRRPLKLLYEKFAFVYNVLRTADPQYTPLKNYVMKSFRLHYKYIYIHTYIYRVFTNEWCSFKS